jgi:CheY-like chemotaxis protein
MIVEDDPAIRNGLSQLLELEGYRVSRAENGFDSLNQLHAGLRPDVIVLDLMMPVMDGWAFLDELRASDRADTPVAVVTSLERRAEMERVVAGHATEFFEKTGELDRLLTWIRSRCGMR